jgi:uncharacterized protein YidB (DUF937 family)
MGLMDWFRSLRGGGKAPKATPTAGATGSRPSAAPAGAGPADGATGAAPTGGADATVKAAMALVGSGGSGLPALLEKLHAGGLGEVVDTWVGTGDNMPVSTSGLTAALGADQISAMAAKAGMPVDVMASGLAKALPGIVDKLTPEGLVPDEASLAGHFATQFGK